MVIKSSEGGHIIGQVRVYNNALNKDKVKSRRRYDPKLRKHVTEVTMKEEKHSS
jgi:hypothetical protein